MEASEAPRYVSLHNFNLLDQNLKKLDSQATKSFCNIALFIAVEFEMPRKS